MTQQFSIAAGDHGSGIAQERFDGMTGRGRLPLVAVQARDIQQNLRDFLLGCTGALSIEGSQHASKTRALLQGQTAIWRDGAAMQGGEETAYSFDTVETVEIERDHRDGDFTAIEGAIQYLEMLPVAEREAEVTAGAVRGDVDSPECRGVAAEGQRSLGQHHDTRVFLRQPEYRGLRRRGPGIDREIATPTAAEFVRSAVRGLRGQRRKLRNRRHTLRCGEGIPMPGRMQLTHPNDRIPSKNARSMRQVSSRSPEYSLGEWEVSGFPRELS